MSAGLRRLGDRGAAAAELAVALPAIVLVLAVCLGAVGVSATTVRLQDAAADAARVLARGQPELVAAALAPAGEGVAQAVERGGGLVCVRLERSVRLAVVASVPVAARACAWDEGAAGAGE